ncbi:MAG TPA: alpha/beta hydrolase [Allosphingosinicella sp.]|jgi:pimeloyl-ACP methyl ester carboxylesterase
MNRRSFLASALALGLAACAPSALEAAPFQPTRFSVVVKGAGPDVILIPGLTASRDVWSGTVANVPGYRYHLVQVAGFGGSPAGGNASGAVVAPVAEEISRYIAANKLGRPAIVGHSMGGTVAMMVAARHPAQVGKAMVVDMLPQPAGLVGSSATGVRGLAESLRGITATPGGRRLVESVVGMLSGSPKVDGRSDPDVVARATHELALTDLTPELPRIAAPLTVVYATPARSEYVDPAQITREYRLAYAGARTAKLVPITNSGHMIMYEQPGAFYAAFRSFLGS